jgi:hypothetical protein
MPRRPFAANRLLARLDHAGRERVAGLVGAVTVLVVLLFVLVLPFLTHNRQIVTEVPQPAPLFSVGLVEMLPRQQACMDQLGLLPGRQVAQLRVGTYGKPPSLLRITLSGSGYRALASVPPSYVDNGTVSAPFTGPSRVEQGVFCITNAGRYPVAVYGAADRTKSRSTTRVDGVDVPANMMLTFFAADRDSLIGRSPEILKRVGLFHPSLVKRLVWPLAVLFLLGVPLVAIVTVLLPGRRPAGDTSEG